MLLRQGLQGIIISSQIGMKVFASTLSPMFGFTSTKCRIFKATKDEAADRTEVEEIPCKGVSELRLKDYGITNDSIIVIVSTSELDTTVFLTVKKTVSQIIGGNVYIKKSPEEIEMQDLKNYGYSPGAVGPAMNN